VLTHGIFMDSTLWDSVVLAIHDRPVLTVDGPGHGRSDEAPADWTLQQYAEALLTVMDLHGLDRAVLAGHSWGGMTSLRVALARPDRVAGLGLVNTPLTRPTRAGRAGFRAQQGMLTLAGPSRLYGRRAAAALYGPGALARRPELAEAMVERLRPRTGRALSRAISAVILEPENMLDQLHRIGAPVTVVAGTSDYVLSPQIRRAVQRALPKAHITTLRGGHISPHEDPDGTLLALKDLLTRSASAGVPDPTRRHGHAGTSKARWALGH
jgi:pimeloyl-ACP methyl ester carboxylesterase